MSIDRFGPSMMYEFVYFRVVTSFSINFPDDPFVLFVRLLFHSWYFYLSMYELIGPLSSWFPYMHTYLLSHSWCISLFILRSIHAFIENDWTIHSFYSSHFLICGFIVFIVYYVDDFGIHVCLALRQVTKNTDTEVYYMCFFVFNIAVVIASCIFRSHHWSYEFVRGDSRLILLLRVIYGML